MSHTAARLTTTQAAAVSHVLADLTRAWADPHKRDTIRQIIALGPGDAHEDIKALYAARAVLADQLLTELSLATPGAS